MWSMIFSGSGEICQVKSCITSEVDDLLLTESAGIFE